MAIWQRHRHEMLPSSRLFPTVIPPALLPALLPSALGLHEQKILTSFSSGLAIVWLSPASIPSILLFSCFLFQVSHTSDRAVPLSLLISGEGLVLLADDSESQWAAQCHLLELQPQMVLKEAGSLRILPHRSGFKQVTSPPCMSSGCECKIDPGSGVTNQDCQAALHHKVLRARGFWFGSLPLGRSKT